MHGQRMHDRHVTSAMRARFPHPRASSAFPNLTSTATTCPRSPIIVVSHPVFPLSRPKEGEHVKHNTSRAEFQHPDFTVLGSTEGKDNPRWFPAYKEET